MLDECWYTTPQRAVTPHLSSSVLSSLRSRCATQWPWQYLTADRNCCRQRWGGGVGGWGRGDVRTGDENKVPQEGRGCAAPGGCWAIVRSHRPSAAARERHAAAAGLPRTGGQMPPQKKTHTHTTSTTTTHTNTHTTLLQPPACPPRPARAPLAPCLEEEARLVLRQEQPLRLRLLPLVGHVGGQAAARRHLHHCSRGAEQAPVSPVPALPDTWPERCALAGLRRSWRRLSDCREERQKQARKCAAARRPTAPNNMLGVTLN